MQEATYYQRAAGSAVVEAGKQSEWSPNHTMMEELAKRGLGNGTTWQREVSAAVLRRPHSRVVPDVLPRLVSTASVRLVDAAVAVVLVRVVAVVVDLLVVVVA